MALVAKRVTEGFELIGNLANVPDNGRLYELTPGIEFKKGDMVVLVNGKVAKAAAGATNVLGVMAESVSAAENPVGAVTYGRVYDNPLNVYRCTFAGHRDAAATGGSSTTLIDTALPTSANDVWNGALLYIYDGPGKGDVRTVKDYVGATDTLVVEKPFSATPTTSTKYILLGAASAVGDVINVGSVGVNLSNERTIGANATIASEAGPLAVLAIYPEDLMMDVVVRKHLYNS